MAGQRTREGIGGSVDCIGKGIASNRTPGTVWVGRWCRARQRSTTFPAGDVDRQVVVESVGRGAMGGAQDHPDPVAGLGIACNDAVAVRVDDGEVAAGLVRDRGLYGLDGSKHRPQRPVHGVGVPCLLHGGEFPADVLVEQPGGFGLRDEAIHVGPGAEGEGRVGLPRGVAERASGREAEDVVGQREVQPTQGRRAPAAAGSGMRFR